jgi:hypothetical protein
MKYCRVGRFAYYSPIFSREELVRIEIRNESVWAISTTIETSVLENFLSSEKILEWHSPLPFRVWRKQ